MTTDARARHDPMAEDTFFSPCISHFYSGVSITLPSYFFLSLPFVLERTITPFLEKERLTPDDRTLFGDDLELGFCTEFNETDLQQKLFELQLPHTFTIEDSDQNYHRVDYRWINGVYSYQTSNTEDYCVTIEYVKRQLEAKAYDVLYASVLKKERLSQAWRFTEEDYSKAKVTSFKDICTGE